LGSPSMRPPVWSWRRASRTGVRLTPKSLASSAWRSWAPIGMSPDMIRSRILAAISSTRACPPAAEISVSPRAAMLPLSVDRGRDPTRCELSRTA